MAPDVNHSPNSIQADLKKLLNANPLDVKALGESVDKLFQGQRFALPASQIIKIVERIRNDEAITSNENKSAFEAIYTVGIVKAVNAGKWKAPKDNVDALMSIREMRVKNEKGEVVPLNLIGTNKDGTKFVNQQAVNEIKKALPGKDRFLNSFEGLLDAKVSEHNNKQNRGGGLGNLVLP